MAKNNHHFLKLVPDELVKKKTGLNVLIHSDCNVANMPMTLCRLINKHTIHRARCVILNGDYLAYDRDIEIISKDAIHNQKAMDEASTLVRKADFYHIMRVAMPWPGVEWSEILKSDNCVFQYWGSIIRLNKNRPMMKLGDKEITLKEFHELFKIKAINYADYSMLEGAGEMFYHLAFPHDVSQMVPCREAKPGEKVKVCHAPTNREIKGTDTFLAVMDRLIKKGVAVELKLIERESHTECMRIKQGCQICFDSLNPEQGLYGSTSVEAMAQAQVALCCINSFTKSAFPDCPVVPVVPQTLEEVIRYYVENPEARQSVGRAGREYVERVHSPLRYITQMVYLYQTIINGTTNIRHDDEVMI